MNRQSNKYACLNTMSNAQTVFERIEHISKSVTFVHIDGRPYKKVLERLLEALPGLVRIELTESMITRLSAKTKEFLKQKGVKISVGFHKPRSAWKKNDSRDPGYEEKKRIFANLSETQKQLFQELLYYGFTEARLLKRYLCLSGEAYISLHILGASERNSSSAEKVISAKIRAVFKYLVPSFPDSIDVRSRVKTIQKMMEQRRREETLRKQRVTEGLRRKRKLARQRSKERLRRKREEELLAEQMAAERLRREEEERILEETRKKIREQLGIDRLPEGLPDNTLTIYAKLGKLEKEGVLGKKLQGVEWRIARMIIRLRYGLWYGGVAYRNADEVGKLLDLDLHVLHQLEKAALKKIRLLKYRPRQ